MMAYSAILKQNIAWFDEPRNSAGALCSRLCDDAANVQGVSRFANNFEESNRMFYLIVTLGNWPAYSSYVSGRNWVGLFTHYWICLQLENGAGITSFNANRSMCLHDQF